MVYNQTKRKIEIPIRLIFSESGVTYFVNQGHRLQRFRLLDDKEEYGIHLVDYAAQTVQKMILLSYVSKIETAISDIVGSRRDLIDLSKLITYGMLYRQFDSSVYDALTRSDLVKHWNRRNAKRPIDFDTDVNHPYLARLLAKNKSVLADLRTRICAPTLAEIDAAAHATDEEKRISRLTVEKLLDSVNPLIWFMLVAARGSQDAESLVSYMQERLSQYLGRASIAEYFALMLIELLNVAKNEVVDEDNEAGPVYLLWRLQHRRRGPGERARLHLMLSNNRTRFEEMRNVFNRRANIEVKGKNLYDFYTDGADVGSGINLGLYYLSFLGEACKKQNVHLESFVNHGSGGRTLIHVSMVL